MNLRKDHYQKPGVRLQLWRLFIAIESLWTTFKVATELLLFASGYLSRKQHGSLGHRQSGEKPLFSARLGLKSDVAFAALNVFLFCETSRISPLAPWGRRRPPVAWPMPRIQTVLPLGASGEAASSCRLADAVNPNHFAFLFSHAPRQPDVKNGGLLRPFAPLVARRYERALSSMAKTLDYSRRWITRLVCR